MVTATEKKAQDHAKAVAEALESYVIDLAPHLYSKGVWVNRPTVETALFRHLCDTAVASYGDLVSRQGRTHLLQEAPSAFSRQLMESLYAVIAPDSTPKEKAPFRKIFNDKTIQDNILAAAIAEDTRHRNIHRSIEKEAERAVSRLVFD